MPVGKEAQGRSTLVHLYLLLDICLKNNIWSKAPNDMGLKSHENIKYYHSNSGIRQKIIDYILYSCVFSSYLSFE